MTMFSFIVRSGNFLFLLPLLLRLEPSDQSVYWQFQFIYGFLYILVAELGLNFIRSLAFVQGGAKEEDLFDLRKRSINNSSKEIKDLTHKVIATIHRSGIYAAIFVFFLLLIFGSLALIFPISLMDNPRSGWIAWYFFIIISSFVTYAGNYAYYIQGFGEVALYRRWEGFVTLISIIAGIISLLYGYGILGLIVAQHSIFALGIIGRRYLALKVLNKNEIELKTKLYDRKIFLIIWSKTWRTTLGVFFHSGIFRLTPIFFAQLNPNTIIMASFGLTFKLMTTIVDFSKAPFYSKLPYLAKEFTLDKKKGLKLIQKRFFYSLILFVFSVIIVGTFGNKILNLLGSNTQLYSNVFWVIFGLAFFVERYSAMHLNIYTLSNHIIWHRMYFISGLIYIFLIIVLYKIFGELSFPISLLLSELIFSSWYSCRHSLELFNISFIKFESKVSLIPLLVLIFYAIFSIYNFIGVK